MTATALKSTPAMKAGLALSGLTDELQILRRRIEANPERYSGVFKQLERAEAAAMAKNIPAARDFIIDLKQRMEERDAAFEMSAQQAEQARLAEVRGAPTHKAETGVSTRDGWLWLVNKGRYSTARVEAGRQFKELYARATDDPMPTCATDRAGGGSGDSDRTDNRITAQTRVNAIRQRMIEGVGLVSGANLYELICLVVGQGVTVRQLTGGKDREAEVKVIELGFALDLAGVYLGPVRV